MSEADEIWNRAALDGGGSKRRAGDKALSSLLRAHGLALNGGVLHAVEVLTRDELADAQEGFQFFGLDNVAALLSRARKLLDDHDYMDDDEHQLDNEYSGLVPNDSALARQFEVHLRAHPAAYSPLK